MHASSYAIIKAIKLLFLQLLQKDGELSQLHDVTETVRKEEFQHDQIQDRLRHYEAQAQLVDTLQNELTSAQVQLVFNYHLNMFLSLIIVLFL